MEYFKTLKEAKDHVNMYYPELKVYQQIPVVKNKYGIASIEFGEAEFWQDVENGWTYNC